MKIYPPLIDDESASSAERLVFNLAGRSALSEGYLGIHSLLLPRHRRNYSGQADFVVLTPRGIIVIEVKGGAISVTDGQWRTTGQGGTAEIQSPFEQANNNMWSLLDAMQAASMPFVYKRHLLGYGVVFPDCRFSLTGAGIESDLLFDSRSLARVDPFSEMVRAIERFWNSRLPSGAKELSSEEWRRISTWLRPRYYGVPSLRADRITLENRMLALLDEQMDFIATARGKARIICRGGAGTGKTLMGLEICRMRHQSGQRSRFVVRNPCLARYLQARGYDPTFILSLEDLARLSPGSLGFLCIDEAQDAMTVDDFAEFDRVLEGGIESGSWLVLLDSENQTGVDGRFDESWLSHLRTLAEADLWLPRNVRNTEEVIQATHLLTGRDICKKGTGHGRKVKYIPYRDLDEASDKALSEIEDLLEQEVPRGEVVLLGRAPMGEQSLAGMLASKGLQISELSASNAGNYPLRDITYSTIRDFKGLESYVAVIDAGEFGAGEMESAEFYVAITRPTAFLFIAYPKKRSAEIARMQESHGRGQ